MPYSESLADRVRYHLSRIRGINEKRMFGGLAFLLHGNLLVAVWHDSLIVRLGPEEAAKAEQLPHVGPFDLTGKPMKGWVLIAADGVDSDRQLANWLDLALQFVRTLPHK